MDFTTILAVADSAVVITALTAIAAIKFGPNVARWGYNKVISFIR
jgi:hypothetical protein